jgi:hypothetical protein
MYERIADNPDKVITYSRVLRRLLSGVAVAAVSRKSWTPFERSLRNTIMPPTAYNELRQLRIPIDITHGRLDFVIARAGIKKMLRSNPNIQFHLVTDAHALSSRSAAFLARLITTKPSSSRHTKSAISPNDV